MYIEISLTKVFISLKLREQSPAGYSGAMMVYCKGANIFIPSGSERRPRVRA